MHVSVDLKKETIKVGETNKAKTIFKKLNQVWATSLTWTFISSKTHHNSQAIIKCYNSMHSFLTFVNWFKNLITYDIEHFFKIQYLDVILTFQKTDAF